MMRGNASVGPAQVRAGFLARAIMMRLTGRWACYSMLPENSFNSPNTSVSQPCSWSSPYTPFFSIVPTLTHTFYPRERLVNYLMSRVVRKMQKDIYKCSDLCWDTAAVLIFKPLRSINNFSILLQA